MQFSKSCYCRQQTVTFEAAADLVDAVFCPACVDRAPEEAFYVKTDYGYYGINPNQSVWANMDERFKDAAYYYERAWGLRKLEIVGLPATFWGMRRRIEFDTSSLSGPDRDILQEEYPFKLPKKLQTRPRESYRPMNH